MDKVVLKLALHRKSIRRYKSDKIDLSKILYAIKTALQAPSGANQQPWRFIIVEDPEVKAEIRKICEDLEKKFYSRVKKELKEWLLSRGFTWKKPFLTEAPYLIAVFAELGKPYAVQSTWLAIGYLLLALEEAGLASLTYTPPSSPELLEILRVPEGFQLQTIIPVGIAGEDKRKEPRKKLHEVTFYNRWGTTLMQD
ncbi:MAG: nitroreductase family protein [Thermoprotei archaeon]|nr:MAG: nitroreductase family protein [Thermoprotei archaeon]